MFDLRDPEGVMEEVRACREAHPEHYIRVSAFDDTRGWETLRLSFLVNRPSYEPGFRLIRQEVEGRHIRYTIESYAAAGAPGGERYGS